MLLKSFHVQKYRNILDSTEVAVQENVTCLVGMNESGKSAMLDALYRLNPVYDDKFSERDDYPRWRWKRDGRTSDLSQVTPIRATFALDDEDRAALSDVFGDDVLISETMTVGRRYSDALWVNVEVDEMQAVANIVKEYGHDRLVHSSHTLADLVRTLEEGGADSSSEDEDGDDASDFEDLLAEAKRRLKGGDDVAGRARSILLGRLPRFFRFNSYQNLEGRLDVQTLRSSQDEEPGASPRQTARALLRLADTDIDAITDEEFESRTAELEAVSSDLSREMSEYWSQNPDLRIRIDVVPQTVPSNSPYGGQTTVVRYLDFRVEDRKHDFTNNFALRSSGYQWFFSFLAAFSEFEGKDERVVILLDEPGLTLHAKAQRDFLRFIDERLAPAGQVVYTTHSPFMVEQVERVRIVEDRGGTEGSVTSSDALVVGEDSAFPLQAALGYDLSQNLFIGENNLLVEGPSDLAYLDSIGRFLREQGRTGLDERWRVLPAGGSSNVPAFVTLLGRKVSVTVLLDSGTEGVGRVEAAIRAGRLDGKRLVFVGEVLGKQHSDIEDLFTPGDYLGLYNEAFGTSHKTAALPQHPDRIVKRLEALDGKFDHWRPAGSLLRQPGRLGRLSETTLANFESLYVALNATMPSGR